MPATTTCSLADQLRDVAAVWARSQHQLVVLAAQFADSSEWLLPGHPLLPIGLPRLPMWRTAPPGNGSASAANSATCQPSRSRSRPGVISYSKVRTLTRIATTTLVMRTTTRRGLGASAEWPTVAQQHADAVETLLTDRAGTVDTEVIVHVRNDGNTLDDGTPVPDTIIERIAPQAFIRAMIHNAHGDPVNVSHRRRHPTPRQKRLVKERDRVCVDCGRADSLQYDHNPPYEQSHHTRTDELDLPCAPCHHKRQLNPHKLTTPPRSQRAPAQDPALCRALAYRLDSGCCG